MPVSKKILRLTDREASVKVYGNEGSATISLDSDLLAPTQTLDANKARKATINSLYWLGDADVVIEIVRNSVVIATMQANAGGMMPFGATGSNFTDNVEDGSNIVVNIIGGSGTKNGQLWLSLTKTSGYKPKIEHAQFSIYDNPNVSGA